MYGRQGGRESREISTRIGIGRGLGRRVLGVGIGVG